jgi:hypothetical protein
VPVESAQWDRLLSKYVRVWLWSILFGATTGLSYSFVAIGVARSNGMPVGMAPLALVAIGAVSTIAAWWLLFVHLRDSIIPEFFAADGAHAAPDSAEVEHEDVAPPTARSSMRQAYVAVMIGAVARLLVALVV